MVPAEWFDTSVDSKQYNSTIYKMRDKYTDIRCLQQHSYVRKIRQRLQCVWHIDNIG